MSVTCSATARRGTASAAGSMAPRPRRRTARRSPSAAGKTATSSASSWPRRTANDLSDLRAFTRDVMGQMEKDLGTQLDWVAVDHFNTGHPHSHVIVRGHDDQGKDLIIAQDYITDGCGCGRRSWRPWSLARRPTGSCRPSLRPWSRPSASPASTAPCWRRPRSWCWTCGPRPARSTATSTGRSASARLQTLERYGLASQAEPGVWTLSERLEPTMRGLGERRRHREGDQPGACRQRPGAWSRILQPAWRGESGHRSSAA